ncbi:MAG: hypothetical protein QXG00_08565 [Candidatus Woesearchaeota archaeon]
MIDRFAKLKQLMKECILNESLEDDILRVYRLILKWQTGNKSDRVEKALRNTIYDVWYNIKHVFTQWKNEHGVSDEESLRVFLYENGFDSQELAEKFKEARDETNPYSMKDFKDDLWETLQNAGLVIPFMDEEVEEVVDQLIEIEFPDDIEIIRIIREACLSAWERHPYAKYHMPQILEQLDEIETVMDEIDYINLDKLIVQFDQIINLSHNTGKFLADYAPINFEMIRKAIDKLGEL